MGVDFSHGDAHFGHASFRAFRRDLAAVVDIDLDRMQGFSGSLSWDAVAEPLAPLLSRTDAGGELSPDECRAYAARLREVLAAPEHELLRDVTAELLAGLDEAARLGEPFILMG